MDGCEKMIWRKLDSLMTQIAISIIRSPRLKDALAFSVMCFTA